MNKSILVKLFVALVILIILLFFAVNFIAEPMVKKKLTSFLNGKGHNQVVTIGDVNIHLLKSGITLRNILISKQNDLQKTEKFTADFHTVKFEGISLIQALKKKPRISNIVVSGCSFEGTLENQDSGQPLVSPWDIHIGKIAIEEIGLALRKADSELLNIHNGRITVQEMQIVGMDTLSLKILKHYQLTADSISVISSDSSYTYKIRGINYSTHTNELLLKQLMVLPNYSDYEFTSRYPYETDRFDADLKNVLLQKFTLTDLLHSGAVVSSHIKIDEMNFYAFRDKRKTFIHEPRRSFQEDIYSYNGRINIDTLSITNGHVIYAERGEESAEAGFVDFRKIESQMFSITNEKNGIEGSDTMIIVGSAFLMGTGKLDVSLKAPLFDSLSTFKLQGYLSAMDIGDINPMLTKNAFVHAKGELSSLRFHFKADNKHATGKLTMMYEDFELTLLDNVTGDSSALRDQLKTFLINLKLRNSNPLPGKELRIGTIDYMRDPEKYVFNYCYKALLTGIESTLKGQ